MRKQILKQHLNGSDFSLCNSLHRTRPLPPTHRDSIRRALFHPLENTEHASCNSDYEPEGREFDSLRARHIFQLFARSALLSKSSLVSIGYPRIRRVHNAALFVHEFGVMRQLWGIGAREPVTQFSG